jgi:hypothetical protein
MVRVAGARLAIVGLTLGASVAGTSVPLPARPAVSPPPPCVDAGAQLVGVGDGVLRCEGGVPVPRPTPWNAGGCGDPRWERPSTVSGDGVIVVPVAPDACLLVVAEPPR